MLAKEGGGGGGRWAAVAEEVKRLGCIGAPMMAVTLSQYSLQVMSTMMVGHLGELYLSSSSLAISLSTVSGFSLLVSLFLSLSLSLSLSVNSLRSFQVSLFYYI